MAEFEQYLDEHNLLPTWKGRLDVVNCASSFEEVVENRVYMCPATGGAYNHQRSQYLGLYRNKSVEYVAAIEAVVEINSAELAVLKWKNADRPDIDYLNAAKHYHLKLRNNEYPMLVFLLSRLYATSFEKDSSGGMYNSKRYFDIASMDAGSAEELASRLNKITWTELGKLTQK